MTEPSAQGTTDQPFGDGHAVSSSSFRAGDGIRTRDIQLGKLVLYQLSYTRTRTRQYRVAKRNCKEEAIPAARVTN